LAYPRALWQSTIFLNSPSTIFVVWTSHSAVNTTLKRTGDPSDPDIKFREVFVVGLGLERRHRRISIMKGTGDNDISASCHGSAVPSSRALLQPCPQR
jgi:hypothetical protein